MTSRRITRESTKKSDWIDVDIGGPKDSAWYFVIQGRESVCSPVVCYVDEQSDGSTETNENLHHIIEPASAPVNGPECSVEKKSIGNAKAIDIVHHENEPAKTSGKVRARASETTPGIASARANEQLLEFDEHLEYGSPKKGKWETENESLEVELQNEIHDLKWELDKLRADKASSDLTVLELNAHRVDLQERYESQIQSMKEERVNLLKSIREKSELLDAFASTEHISLTTAKLVVALEKKRAWKKKAHTIQDTCKKEFEAKLKVENEKLDDEKDKRMCIVCLEKPRDVLPLPCSHLYFCYECLDKCVQINNTCPVCRARVIQVQKCILA